MYHILREIELPKFLRSINLRLDYSNNTEEQYVYRITFTDFEKKDLFIPDHILKQPGNLQKFVTELTAHYTDYKQTLFKAQKELDNFIAEGPSPFGAFSTDQELKSAALIGK